MQRAAQFEYPRVSTRLTKTKKKKRIQLASFDKSETFVFAKTISTNSVYRRFVGVGVGFPPKQTNDQRFEIGRFVNVPRAFITEADRSPPIDADTLNAYFANGKYIWRI